MILITGATGNIGAPLVKELVTAGQQLRAFVTDPAKAKQKLGDKVELAKGNLGDPASLDAAMKGVTRVFLLAPPAPDSPFDGNVVAAAKKAGVGHIVKLSVAGAQYDATRFGKWHRVGEKAVEASGIPWTFLRPVGFQDNAFMWVQTVKSQGAIYQPLGDGKMAAIDARDIAAVAAKCLASPASHANKAYDLTGPEALSMTDQAKQLGDAIGKPVKYVDVPDAAAKDAMVGMGFPAIMADAMLEFTGMVRAGQAAMVSDAVKTITGTPGRTFAAWCREHAAAFK
jgi:uncharacterized protein YbjT (DUF2867 family)